MRHSRRLLTLAAAAVLSAAQTAWACGGNGEPPCTTSPAAFQRNINCDGGSFRDPRNDGECWSCGGWNRTWSAVTAGDACSTPGYTSVSHATKVKKTGWAGDCGSGTFWDGYDWGGCWTCSGWNRTAAAVYAADACSKAFPEQKRGATFVKAAHCSSGEFSDPRNGGECWTCPSGYDRTAAAVTAADACVARNRCASGSIEYGGACWTKGACGTDGGRACTLGERIPSCNSGLKEDRGRCVPLLPGESAFLGGLGTAFANVAKDGQKACDDAFAAIPKLNTGNPYLDGAGACSKAQMTGFLCAATGLPGQIGGATELVRKISVEYDRDPCKVLGIAIPHRALCSTAMAMGRDLGDAFACMTEATAGGAFSAIPVETLCRLEGELAFEVALMVAGGAVAEEGEAASSGAAAQEAGVLQKIARALLKANDAVGKANTANSLADKMNAIAACRRMAGGAAGGQRAAAQASAAGLPVKNTPDRIAKGDLLFYRVNAAGTFTLTNKKIGNGWDILSNLVPAGAGVVYGVDAGGNLLLYRHDENGAFTVAAKKIGTEWGGGQTVLSVAPGTLALRKADGTLWLYYFDAAGANTGSRQIGTGWGGFTKVLSGGNGVFYGIEPNGDLFYYSYNLAGATWNFTSRKIGTGWLQDPVVFSGGNGDLFTMDAAGTLYRYHHREDGAFVVARQQVGAGWTEFGRIAAAADGSGAIYGIVK